MEDPTARLSERTPVIAVAILALATLTGLTPGLVSAAASEEVSATIVPVPAEWRIEDRVIVGLAAPVEDAEGTLRVIADAHDAELVATEEDIDAAALSVAASQQDTLLEALAAIDAVAYAMPDVRVEGAGFTPDDPLLGDQWAVDAIGLETAWGRTLGDGDVEVAVIDSGTRYTHEDLEANVCRLGPDFVNGDSDPDDTHGHGTHVAGTVAAEIDNGIGVAGMANACIVPVKVLDSQNSGTLWDIAASFAWAGADEVDIASASLGSCPGCPVLPPMEDAVRFAWEQGTLLVAAAHNQECSPVSYPAAYPEVISVASLGSATERSDFSNCGPENELSAPGSAILSTLPTDTPWNDTDGYGYGWGTSMATPHVSGVAAQLMSLDPSLTHVDTRCILQETADDLGPAGPDDEFGIGRLDPAEATTLPEPDEECNGLWPPAPANDEPSGAIPIEHGDTLTQHTAGATSQTHERAICGTLQGATVWYVYDHGFEAPQEVTLDTFGSGFDTVLSVHQPTPEGPSAPLTCNDDAGGERQSQLSFRAAPGATYLIQLGGWSGDQGPAELTLS